MSDTESMFTYLSAGIERKLHCSVEFAEGFWHGCLHSNGGGNGCIVVSKYEFEAIKNSTRDSVIQEDDGGLILFGLRVVMESPKIRPLEELEKTAKLIKDLDEEARCEDGNS